MTLAARMVLSSSTIINMPIVTDAGKQSKKVFGEVSLLHVTLPNCDDAVFVMQVGTFTHPARRYRSSIGMT